MGSAAVGRARVTYHVPPSRRSISLTVFRRCILHRQSTCACRYCSDEKGSPFSNRISRDKQEPFFACMPRTQTLFALVKESTPDLRRDCFGRETWDLGSLVHFTTDHGCCATRPVSPSLYPIPTVHSFSVRPSAAVKKGYALPRAATQRAHPRPAYSSSYLAPPRYKSSFPVV
ncbi:hypothetical protein GGR52DRAFT_256796 [Hypoxylon sp. FL1284]|nr:hypothetical protein GGR52DRAFT_256796 [Hypoxylon sp. FL1284]